MIKLAFVFSLFFVSNLLFSQSRVSGKVIDSETKEAVIGAYIILKKDPSVGTVSNVEGEFDLDLPEGTHQLIFKYSFLCS